MLGALLSRSQNQLNASSVNLDMDIASHLGEVLMCLGVTMFYVRPRQLSSNLDFAARFVVDLVPFCVY